MTLGKLNKRVIGDKLYWIDNMIAEIQALPLENYKCFIHDRAEPKSHFRFRETIDKLRNF